MYSSRRDLPPLPALRALEALDRLGSATAVAEELHLTQSAISRQLKSLEDHLGVRLYLRDRRALRLTDEARAFAQVVREALDRIAQGALSLRLQEGGGGGLRLAILPSFGMRWLVPRLPEFAARHPEVTVNMTTRLRPFSFASEGFDAALHYSALDRPDWPGVDHLALSVEMARPLAAPALLPRGPMAPELLARQPLLHIETRPDAWARWFAAQGAARQGPLPGTGFDQFTTILQAALHGLGIALLPDYLTETERASGQLQEASTRPAVRMGTYFLVWPGQRRLTPALRAFRDWLALHGTGDEPLPR
jgi:DNA-binding transcriptional LysR family regulator